jgi:hypothetical protein
MSDLVIVAANVVPGANANLVQGTAGETITAGKPVYKDPTSHKWMLADADAATAAARGSDESNTGIALTGSSLNQPIVVATGGDVTYSAIFTAGLAYFLSNTAGGICLAADIGTGEYVVQLGIALSTTVLSVRPEYTGVQN